MKRNRHPIRFYSQTDGSRLPSVTSILGRTDPIFDPSKESSLEWWRKKEVNHRQILDEACNRGKMIHQEIEIALSGKLTEDEPSVQEWIDYGIPDYMTHLVPYLHELQCYDLETEKVVIHEKGRYAGTADLILEDPNGSTLIDWKTTRHHKDVGEKLKPKSRYKTAKMQVAAYSAAYNTLPSVPPITKAKVVVLYSWREPYVIDLDAEALADNFTLFADRLYCFHDLEGVY